MKKNDLSTGIGLILGFVAIVFGMLKGGSLRMFWDLPSLFITVFGSFFALVISYPASALKNLVPTLKNAFIEKQISSVNLILKFSELSKKARKEGLLSLEDEVENVDDQFMKSGIQMVVDGIEPETIREILELEIGEMENRHQNGIAILKTWSSLAPAFGMIGTLIGLIQMLAKLQDQTQLGKGMAVALITSFYGAVMANLVFTPMANKLDVKSQEEVSRREMMVEGVLAIQSGVNPRIVEEKLKTYLSPSDRLKFLNTSVSGNMVIENE